MAARADQLGDSHASDPTHWDPPFGSGQIHIALSIIAPTKAAWQDQAARALKTFDTSGLTVLGRTDFAAHPGTRTSLGCRDGISFPNIAGLNPPDPPAQSHHRRRRSSSSAAIRVHSLKLSTAAAPLLERFRSMSMDERWVLREPVEMYRTFPWFQREGFKLLIEDLESLPTGSIIIVKGFRLLPYLVRPCWPSRVARSGLYRLRGSERRRSPRGSGRSRFGCEPRPLGAPWPISSREMRFRR
jgi:hypothetical protein